MDQRELSTFAGLGCESFVFVLCKTQQRSVQACDLADRFAPVHVMRTKVDPRDGRSGLIPERWSGALRTVAYLIVHMFNTLPASTASVGGASLKLTRAFTSSRNDRIWKPSFEKLNR